MEGDLTGDFSNLVLKSLRFLGIDISTNEQCHQLNWEDFIQLPGSCRNYDQQVDRNTEHTVSKRSHMSSSEPGIAMHMALAIQLYSTSILQCLHLGNSKVLQIFFTFFFNTYHFVSPYNFYNESHKRNLIIALCLNYLNICFHILNYILIKPIHFQQQLQNASTAQQQVSHKWKI